MSFRLDTSAPDPDRADDWPLPRRPRAMSSTTLIRLKDDLRRYCEGEIAGRSFLIAGHRGAGKTTLTLRAIDDVRYDLLQAALNPPAIPGSRRLGVQRPLLVKLHGPSLLGPVKAAKDAAHSGNQDHSDSSQDPPAGPAGPGGTDNAKSKQVTASAPASDAMKADAFGPSDAANADSAHLALVQLTIALYRQLAAEAAFGFGIKAEALPPERFHDLEEIWAQLVLDLDSGASPGALRSYWQAVGRLKAGVLWPRKTDDTPSARPGPGKQGLKEILALAAAGHAYRKCTGLLTQQTEDTDARSHEEKLTATVSPDIKELVARLGTLGVGALAGAALWQSNPFGAVVGGALVWLLGTVTLGWSLASSRKRDRVEKYTFLPDTKPETLDRDLPAVIQRIRDAGLSPVFVIDELDKVKQSADTIDDIIARLKHIIADFGFFCFLTDRGYFDYVEARVQSTAYPIEHTFFSERRLLAYAPADFRKHLEDILKIEGQATDLDQRARDLLVLHLIHKSRLNFALLSRELGRMADSGDLAADSDAILQRTEMQVNATVQLAIEATLRVPARAERVAADPGFAQLMYDTLYNISRSWSDEEQSTYDGRRQALLDALGKRAAAGEVKSSRNPEKATISPADKDALIEAHAELIERLSNFESLKEELARSGVTELARQASLITLRSDIAGLLARKQGKPSSYEFRYSPQGRPLVGPEAHIDNDDAQALIETIQAFQTLLAFDFAGMALDDLKTGRLLPATLDTGAVAASEVALAEYRDGALPRASALPACETARNFRNLLDGLGPKQSVGMVLAKRLVLAAGGGASVRDALTALGRYPILGELVSDKAWSLKQWLKDFPSFAGIEFGTPLAGNAAAIAAFGKALSASTWEDSADPRFDDNRAMLWDLWHDRLSAFIQGKMPRPEDFGLADLLGATRRVAPASLLPMDIGGLSAFGWSTFCVHALAPVADNPVPRWALVAALRILRFGRPALLAAAQELDARGQRPSADELQRAAAFAEGADPDRPGALYVTSAPEAERLDMNDPIPSEGPAVLYVTRSHAEQKDVGSGLDWLERIGVLEAKVDDSGTEI